MGFSPGAITYNTNSGTYIFSYRNDKGKVVTDDAYLQCVDGNKLHYNDHEWNLFDFDENRYAVFINSKLIEPWVSDGTGDVNMRVEAPDGLNYCLFVRVKADISPYHLHPADPDGRYLGYLYLEYVNSNNQVITVRGPTKGIDEYITIKDYVREFRLVAKGQRYGTENGVYLESELGFYTIEPFFCSRTHLWFHKDGSDYNVVNGALWNEGYGFNYNYNDNKPIITVPTNHPFASALRVRTSIGDRALIAI